MPGQLLFLGPVRPCLGFVLKATVLFDGDTLVQSELCVSAPSSFASPTVSQLLENASTVCNLLSQCLTIWWWTMPGFLQTWCREQFNLGVIWPENLFLIIWKSFLLFFFFFQLPNAFHVFHRGEASVQWLSLLQCSADGCPYERVSTLHTRLLGLRQSGLLLPSPCPLDTQCVWGSSSRQSPVSAAAIFL